MPNLSNSKEREESIATFVVDRVRNCEHTTVHDRRRWKIVGELFQGKQDFGSAREDNSSRNRVFLHEYSKLVRTGASAIQDIIHQNPEFYDLSPPEGEEEDAFANIFEKIVRHRVNSLNLESYTYDFCLQGGMQGLGINKLVIDRPVERVPEIVIGEIQEQEQKEAKGAEASVEKTPVVMPDNPEAVAGQMLTVMDQLVGEIGGEKRQTKKRRLGRQIKAKNRLGFRYKLRVIDADNFFFEPAISDVNESPWHAERSHPKLYQLNNLFKNGTLDRKKRKELLRMGGPSRLGSSSGATIQSTKVGQDWTKRDQITNPDNYSPHMEVLEYFGPWLARGGEFKGRKQYEKGEIIEEHCWFVVANGKVVLKDAQNPYWSGKSPYFTSVFSKVPNKAIGAGVADNAIQTQELVNELMSLYLDHLMFTILGVKGVNQDDLDPSEWRKIKDGFVPGQIVKLNAGNKKASDVFTDINYNEQLGFNVVQILEKLTNSGESATSIDTTSSNPTNRARISAAEVQSNVDRSARSQFSLAYELDETYVRELIKRVVAFCLQFDMEEPVLRKLQEEGVITQSEFKLLTNLDRVARFQQMNKNYKIQVKGFRENIQRSDFLSRISEFMQQITQLSTISSAADSIDWSELVRVFAEAYKVPSDRLIFQNTPQDLAREENALLRGERFVGINPQDQHALHLPIHYEELMKNQTQSLIQHTVGHIQILAQQGIDFPEPPPEIQGLLGIQQPEAPASPLPEEQGGPPIQ